MHHILDWIREGTSSVGDSLLPGDLMSPLYLSRTGASNPKEILTYSSLNIYLFLPLITHFLVSFVLGFNNVTTDVRD